MGTGIVVVSHSRRLAEAARELASQMVPDGAVPVRLAAGAGEEPDGTPILGTDATRVAAAIDEIASECDGVLVVMDLGSAVMSAEFALELRESDVPVRLSTAPFVEGLLAACVTAAQGASLADVAAEADGALVAKVAQLRDAGGSPEGAADTLPPDAPAPDASAPDVPVSEGGGSDAETVRTVRVRNPLGVHARPASLIAQAAQGEELRLRRLPDGDPVPAASMMRLLALGVREGEEIEVRGDPAAVDRVTALFDDGFGELAPAGDGGAAPVPSPPVPSPAEPSPTRGGEIASSEEGTASPVDAGTALRGRGVSSGRAVGPVVTLGASLAEPDASVRIAEDARGAEAGRIAPAAAAVAETLRERAARSTGEAAQILAATAQLAADPDLAEGAAARVRADGVTAARGVWEQAHAQERILHGLGGRMAERVADVRSVRDRLLAQLTGQELPGVPEREDPFVLVAADLAPAETAALDESACVALVTQEGGPTSHTAILARALGLPAVVGLAGATALPAGTVVLVDGSAGTVLVDPPAALRDAPVEVVAPFDGRAGLADGSPVPLLANVGDAAGAVSAAEAGADGIGLFRTEFCFLDRTTEPTVTEQIEAYRGVFAPFAGRKVVVRTLDAGSDKPLPFATAAREENPALGVRGLRIARAHPEILAHQLEAIARAAEGESAEVEVMAPMVAAIDEAEAFVRACRDAGIARAGIMIETPSAALLATELLAVVDFVSLGTNDLAQYTMAADRLSAPLGALNDPWQPAVLRLIGLVGEAGRATGKPVGVCGEAGGDPALAPVLLGLGATSLSMTARSLAPVAARLRTVSAEDCRRAAGAALVARTAADARRAAEEALG